MISAANLQRIETREHLLRLIGMPTGTRPVETTRECPQDIMLTGFFIEDMLVFRSATGTLRRVAQVVTGALGGSSTGLKRPRRCVRRGGKHSVGVDKTSPLSANPSTRTHM